MKILVTGGAGYIGSHTCIRLIENGFDIVIADNLYNSKMEAVRRVEKITGQKLKFYLADMCNRSQVEEIFQNEQIDGVIHFAAYKAVGESVSIPLRYYDNNLQSTIVLLETMQKYGVKNFVFSSSATVYGLPKSVPIREDFPLSATNPYGQTKLMIEQILKDVYHADPDMNIAILRYFNPVGAHESGLIGEDPKGIPNNLVPYITQVAVGKLEKLKVFGGDYDTKDGTGVRDYIHVLDLADGHVAALNKLSQNSGLVVYNLGTGTGYSVLEMIRAFEKVSGRTIPYEIVERRPGDIAECYADPTKAKEELNWEAKFGLEKMCEDSWRWQLQNPNGYEE
ncbi:MAG: UDP-glucose 4-epimerase [Epulopiscium sp.]|uniref:UDP-glucose 4-epimerase n=1 Tax=Defluviitalea raffinosedens TaxID=1450156 RepID=A0A7C8HGR6_9FIRM|nr:UDP-glucose 4-epimerase GalE [Defluviitalea raffinosedens]MBZ4668260.1 galE [Defluviitaleaceae bacterium]MDK2787043.1 UDP-glucose 4-epimerase [Candidatus Epulonipiscium sp.]KAE9634454.1 UDP-glucose 4-epimerase GalE [Defluviitalea raffinosedens]MBM7684751.1 UDP-glucose 4-epimerase [Defluviitalea raffinosedens]HHW66981.1 UDP-glucose 4-epimerase GalE [Candidatus Epulonipiscium sp.]